MDQSFIFLLHCLHFILEYYINIILNIEPNIVQYSGKRIIKMQSSSTFNNNNATNNISQSNSVNSFDKELSEKQQYMQDQSYFGHVIQNMSPYLQNKYLTNKNSVLLNHQVPRLNSFINKNIDKTSNQFQTQFKKTHFNQQVYPIISSLPVFLFFFVFKKPNKQNFQKSLKQKKMLYPAFAFLIFSGLVSLSVFNQTFRESKKLIYRHQNEVQKLVTSLKFT